jgi:hypothetical protein
VISPGVTVSGRYLVTRPLGRGGMATVYAAYDPKLDLEVALKVLPLYLAGDPTFRTRFQREGQTLARLTHSNILRLYELQEDPAQELSYLVLEYLPGGTLKERITPGQAWDIADVVEVLGPVASALDYAHGQTPSVLHRDLKPSNLMFAADGRPVVCDFGLAHLFTPDVPIAGTAAPHPPTLTGSNPLGTPQYMAPEQAEGRAPSPQSDLYALGVIAYQLLVGHLPYEADTPLATLIQIARDPLPLPTALNPVLAPAAERVLLKALAKSPEHRFARATELVEALAVAGELTRVGGETFLLEVTGTPTGAEVRVDGRVRGTLPARIGGLRMGPHAVEVRTEGYESLQEVVSLPTTQPLEAILSPMLYDLVIEGEPRGAAVVLDGIPCGQLPLTLSGHPGGEHRLMVSAPGYALLAQTVNLPHEGPLRVSLEPGRYALVLEGEPVGAAVHLDGQYVGSLPCTVEGLLAGEHQLTVSAPGYASLTQTVELPRKAPFSLSLQAIAPPRVAQAPASPTPIRKTSYPLRWAATAAIVVLLIGGLVARVAVGGSDPTPTATPERSGRAIGLAPPLSETPPALPVVEGHSLPPPLVTSVCPEAETYLVSANATLAEGSLGATLGWLASLADCPDVDVPAARWAIDRLGVAEQYVVGRNWTQLLEKAVELQADPPPPDFSGWRSALGGFLIDAGEIALRNGDWRSARRLCEEAVNVQPEEAAGFQCIAAAQPSPTSVPTASPMLTGIRGLSPTPPRLIVREPNQPAQPTVPGTLNPPPVVNPPPVRESPPSSTPRVATVTRTPRPPTTTPRVATSTRTPHPPTATPIYNQITNVRVREIGSNHVVITGNYRYDGAHGAGVIYVGVRPVVRNTSTYGMYNRGTCTITRGSGQFNLELLYTGDGGPRTVATSSVVISFYSPDESSSAFSTEIPFQKEWTLATGSFLTPQAYGWPQC